MKITTNWNSGNFSLRHQVEVTAGQLEELAADGLLYRMQRNREHDEVLGAFKKEGDKKVRKAGWKRIDVGYADNLAKALASTDGYKVLKFGNEGEQIDAIVPVVTEVTEYVRTQSAEGKPGEEEKEIAGRHESAGDLEEWLAVKCNYTGETHSEDGEYHPAMLMAVNAAKRAAIAAARKAQLAGL